MTIIESNKLIAEFMGWETKQNIVLIPYKFSNEQTRLLPKENDKYCADISDLGFHYDWNWLMSVVEKIESQNQRVEIIKHICRIRVNENVDIVFSENMSKIEAVYNAVVEFILWFNKNGK